MKQEYLRSSVEINKALQISNDSKNLQYLIRSCLYYTSWDLKGLISKLKKYKEVEKYDRKRKR